MCSEFKGRHPTRSPGQRGFLAVPTSKAPMCLPNPRVTLSETYLNETGINYFHDQQQAVVVFFFPKLRKIMSEREILKHTAHSPDLPAVPWDCSAHSCLCFRSRSCTSPLPAAAHLATRSAEALLSHRHVPTASFRCWAGRWVSRHSSCGRTNRQVKGKTLRFL